MGVLGMATLACWVFLPKWAPAWVIDNSPWIEPVVRAYAHLQRTTPDGPTVEQGWPSPIEGRQRAHFDDDTWYLTHRAEKRLVQWGVAAIPTLTRCLWASDDNVRITAAEFLWRLSIVESALVGDWVRDPNPWIRLRAWEVLTEFGSGDHARPEVAGVLQSRLPLLIDEPEEFIREQFLPLLIAPKALTWEQRHLIYEHLPKADANRMEIVVTVLENLFQERLATHPDERLPMEALFPLLDFSETYWWESENESKRVRFLLSRIDQDLEVVSKRLDAMSRGDQPWAPGAERWMQSLLSRLTGERVTLSVKDAELSDVIAQHFPNHNIIVNPGAFSGVDSRVSLQVADASVLDALQALARATNTRLQIACGAVLFQSRFPKDLTGFVNLPTIWKPRHELGSPGVPAWVTSWQTVARIPGDLAVVDSPLVQVLTDLAREGGVSIDTTQVGPDDRLTGINLRGLTLDQRFRLIAWLHGLPLLLGVNDIQVGRPWEY
jgi:hypothetical protein